MKADTLNILSELSTFSLKELESADLLERKDFKYVINAKHLNDILKNISTYYKVLKIKDFLYTDYHTNYYDTNNLKFYLQHHNGEANRYKIRTRNYVQSNLAFFEVKYKNNKDWTSKTRFRIDSLDANINDYIKAVTNETLYKSLEVKYSRITLLSNDGMEKVTIDVNLEFNSMHKQVSRQDLCIIEVKSKTHHPYMLRKYLKQLGYRGMGLSKYCYGITQNYSTIKINNFKQTISKILKLTA